MRLLVVDHAFHKRTRSNAFFIEILEDFFELTLIHVDPTDHAGLIALEAVEDVDLVLLWQMDFLAPIFLARGLPTAVVPMYDGSSEMPDLHWIWARHAYFVNFSRTLHERVRRMRATSLNLKYFGAPAPESSLPRFDDGLHVFLWHRCPEKGINLRAVETLFGDQLASVHIHDAPDDPRIDRLGHLVPARGDYRLTVSTWFDQRAAYERVIERCNVFVAPRRTEGIGLGFIEAMANGMLIVAPDQPTHNEYLANWLNGVLFNPDNVSYARFDEAAGIARLGWQTVRDGHRLWLESLPKLVAFLQSTPKPPPMPGIDTALLARGLVRAYLGGSEAYRRYLLAHADTVACMSGMDLQGRLTADGTLMPPHRQHARTNPFRAGKEMPWLPQNRLRFADGAPHRYLLSGRLEVGDSASFGFRIDLGLGAPRQLHLSIAVGDDADARLCVGINGWTAGFLTLEPGEQVVALDLPPQAIATDNVLSFQLGGGGGRRFGVESWSLT
jgi:hypothetical protein